MRYVAAIDQGTTSSRFMVFDMGGNIVASAQQEHQQIFPQPGWVEHDPEEIAAKVKLVTAEALITKGLLATDIAAIGITNQRETTVVWNKHTGKPYYNAIVWQDTRTEHLVKKLNEQLGHNAWQQKTGLPFATYFSSLKLKWLLDNVHGLQQAAENGDALFGNIDTWLLWKETGEHKTDVTNASRTQLMHLETLDWDDEILQTLNIPRQMLPQIVPSSGYFGTIQQGAFKGINIMGVLGDQQAALVGQTCFEPGQAKNTYGTGCFMLMNTGEKIVPSTKGLLTTVAYKLGQQPVHYALEGSIAMTGSLVQWCRDNLDIIDKSSDIETLAASVPDNGDVYFVPAFSGLYAPYWRSDARGVITGLTGYATKAHIARAVLEATAYQTLDVLLAMQADSGITLDALNVDGGMTANNLLMQFQADMVQVPVQVPMVNETTCLGAAYAAGLASGYWKSVDDLKANHQINKRWQPAMDQDLRHHLHLRWQKAIGKSLDWV
ncbi:MAG: glycerol kinase GlpK [Bacteroidetes bacterium]|uniref:glycerol kinase GlpK n=1 Tax=Phnomibacter sp. TaxID=2836217 RepID=UPI002FDCC593|nr:glycerol kinase GlpK [Bacteroidota bacterium]